MRSFRANTADFQQHSLPHQAKEKITDVASGFLAVMGTDGAKPVTPIFERHHSKQI